MNAREVAQTFYSRFQARDGAGMAALYAKQARFSDPAFTDLDGEGAGAMWTMLTTRGKDLTLTFEILEATESTATVNWIATYTFSPTGRKVVNDIIAKLEVSDGKILRHTDSFDFYSWAKQALGLIGLLLGWTDFIKGKVKANAAKSLQAWRAKNGP
jgi:ketosteroid isomerase-like protein